MIIVGTGAGGGTLARTLAPSGKRILLLERGDFLPREMDNWDPGCAYRPGPAGSATTRPRGARRQLQAHELDNLYVVDTSFFPSIGAVNPALTAIRSRASA